MIFTVCKSSTLVCCLCKNPEVTTESVRRRMDRVERVPYDVVEDHSRRIRTRHAAHTRRTISSQIPYEVVSYYLGMF
jgi:hypothetical protein